MSGPLSKSLGLSSASTITEDAINGTEKQGMPSSEEFPVFVTDSSSEGDDCQDKELEKPCQFDIWSSIISKKANNDSSISLPPPYVHSLVKRSANGLSEKSLEICTESLGSETGSDGFSSYPPSETSYAEEDQHGVLQQQKTACFDDENDQPRTVKCNKYNVIGKKSPQHGSFPPPISSLSRKGGASVRMETHRDNGRLVLEAVSVPSMNNFFAQRQDGRLVLTFANTINEAGVFESFGTEANIFDDEEDVCREMEHGIKLECGATNVHRSAAMMNKPLWFANRNPTWPKSFDEIVEPTAPPPAPRVARLIPPPQSTTAAASFNAYEYYWRRHDQPMSSKAAILTSFSQQSPQLFFSKKQTANDHHQHQMVVLRGNNGHYLVPLSKGCKEAWRSVIFLFPYCIATS
ncbi:U-box domain-containing protein 23 [Hibiscus syriacus]|uniref:U-box domain-containing protein 23 n=1 Tax=Hibiscus syriacus TaxID=106335 RepID=A0A6A3A8E3_HIBSY|nr:protein FAF-like, chloroplastic [Hibiscus syriacus]KAE8700226.1 U-box domain-containing protein 23 [Hibiscus syriacus]